MDPNKQEPTKVVERLLAYGALLAAAVIVAAMFAIYRPPKDALRLLAPGTAGSLLAILLVYVFRQTLFKSTESYLSEQSVALLSDRVGKVVEANAEKPPSVVVFARWNDVPWSEVLKDTRLLEFHVSYMDTWVALAADALLQIFQRGGTIRAYLPNPGTESAARVKDRFPEYPSELITAKISNTAAKLHGVLNRSGNSNATLDIRYTNTFIMHCLMRIDHSKLILSPFDHFRRAQIEGPAFLLRLEDYPHVAEWANKEFLGFERGSDPEEREPPIE